MPSKVDSHFEDYKEQTRIKHEILTKYLKPYFEIRAKGNHDNLVYIDAFAGCGEYKSDAGAQPGSPIRALATFASLKSGIGGKVTSIFIEERKAFFDELVAAVLKFAPESKGLRTPHLSHGTFESEVNDLLSALRAKNAQLAPSFLFADPCGVDGLKFSALIRYLKEAQGEAFLFFNYSGVTRIAGVGYKAGGTLVNLLGGDDRARSLIERLEGQNADAKEEIIIAAYLEALDYEIKDLFSTAFRIEFEDKRSTSHYLIHLTRNDLGFKLMKEIMWPLGRTNEGDGALSLEQASVAGNRPLFRPRWDEVKASILRDLQAAAGPLATNYFYDTLSSQRGNQLCRPAYRKALLELEAAGRVIIKKGDNITTAATRPKRGGPTLGDNYSIHLAKRVSPR